MPETKSRSEALFEQRIIDHKRCDACRYRVYVLLIARLDAVIRNRLETMLALPLSTTSSLLAPEFRFATPMGGGLAPSVRPTSAKLLRNVLRSGALLSSMTQRSIRTNFGSTGSAALLSDAWLKVSLRLHRSHLPWLLSSFLFRLPLWNLCGATPGLSLTPDSKVAAGNTS